MGHGGGGGGGGCVGRTYRLEKVRRNFDAQDWQLMLVLFVLDYLCEFAD